MYTYVCYAYCTSNMTALAVQFCASRHTHRRGCLCAPRSMFTMHVYTHMHIHIHDLYVSMYASIYIYTLFIYLCMYVYIYIYIYIYTYTYIHIYLYIYSYIIYKCMYIHMQVATGKIMHRIYTALESHAAQTPKCQYMQHCTPSNPHCVSQTLSHKGEHVGSLETTRRRLKDTTSRRRGSKGDQGNRCHEKRDGEQRSWERLGKQ